MFTSLFTDIEAREKQFTVYAPDDATDVDAQFATHNVSISHRTVPTNGPEPFLVIEADGEFAGAIGLDALEGVLEPPIVRPGASDRADVSEGYRVLFDVLDETVFTSMERSQLLAVSREVEDRAFRVGSGTLRVAFQDASTFRAQVDVYRHLASETELDIHVHRGIDWTTPAIEGVSFHTDTELDRHWVLAFDGGGSETRTCGLVARERDDGYDGFWTDDAEMVEDVLARLEAT